MVCPRCDREIWPGEEVHPVLTPFHSQCQVHEQCYVRCAGEHCDVDAAVEALFDRAKAVERETLYAVVQRFLAAWWPMTDGRWKRGVEYDGMTAAESDVIRVAHLKTKSANE